MLESTSRTRALVGPSQTMTSLTANAFQKQLGEELASVLRGEFKFFRSSLQLRRSTANGKDVIILAGSNAWSPFISVSFYFGRNFDQVRALEKRHSEYAMPYHVQQYSPNLRSMAGIEYSGPHTWNVDLREPPESLAHELGAAVRGMAEPFFARFADLRAARDAIASNDPWCFGGHAMWRALLKLDAALGELAHFREWNTRLGEFEAKQASEMLALWDPEA